MNVGEYNSPLMEAVRRHNEGLEFFPAVDEEQDRVSPDDCHREGHVIKCCCAPKKEGLLDRLLSDKDALLIAAVILVLLNQNADKKLIMALAFVLLA